MNDGVTACGDDPSVVCATATVTSDTTSTPTPSESTPAPSESTPVPSEPTPAPSITPPSATPSPSTTPTPAADAETSAPSVSRFTANESEDPVPDDTVSYGCQQSARSARWTIARWSECSHRGGLLTLVTTQGEQVGTVRYETFHEVTGNPTKGQWSNAFMIKVTKTTGVGAETEVTGEGSCIGKCTYTSGTTIEGVMAPGAVLQDVANYKWHGEVGTHVTPRPWWDFNYSHPDGITIDGAAYKAPTIRCDREYPGLPNSVGCVFPQQPADEWVSPHSATAWATHVSAAQYSGLPVSLHRATKAQITANRAAACATAPKPRPTGYECDEYPYASSVEGAAAGTGTVRVLNLPDYWGNQFCGMTPTTEQTGAGGWSICLIPREDNSEGGTLLNNLYKAFRVIPGDEFSTRISWDQ